MSDSRSVDSVFQNDSFVVVRRNCRFVDSFSSDVGENYLKKTDLSL